MSQEKNEQEIKEALDLLKADQGDAVVFENDEKEYVMIERVKFDSIINQLNNHILNSKKPGEDVDVMIPVEPVEVEEVKGSEE